MTLREIATAAALAFLGLALLGSMTVQPARWTLAARTWDAQTCTIVEAQAISSLDSESVQVHRIQATYTYEVGGEAHEVTGYGVVDRTFSGDEVFERLKGLTPGARVPCWVAPSNPEVAVLDRTGDWSVATGLLGLVFLFPAFSPLLRPSSGPVKLDTGRRAAMALAATLAMALLATGALAVVVLAGGEWGPFSVIFVAFGGLVVLGMWAVIPLAVSRLFRTRVVLDVDALVSGETARMTWEAARPLAHLRVQLVGTHLRDAGEATVRTEVWRGVLLEVDPGRATGEATVDVPAEPAEDVVWNLEIDGRDDRGKAIFERLSIVLDGPGRVG